MSMRSSMQMLNLGLSIFNKVQAIQHRQIKITQLLRKENRKQYHLEPQDFNKLSDSKKNIILEDKEI